ncbi:MAG: TetR/AcrR family transcriptional regulator [Candidatus Acidiferrales bacterium]
MMVFRNAGSRERNSKRAREGRRERHREEIRQRLYRAALKLFAERGFLETTVEDITEAADVGKGTFFNYFPTKEHVLAAFGMERVTAIEQAYEKARNSPAGVLPVLRELATNLAGQWKESPALLRAIYAAHASCAPVRAELLKRVRKGRQIISRIFSLAQARGEVRRDIPAAELARLTQLVFMGLTLSWAMNPEGSIRKTSEEVWELFSIDFRARPHKLRSGRGPKTAAMK